MNFEDAIHKCCSHISSKVNQYIDVRQGSHYSKLCIISLYEINNHISPLFSTVILKWKSFLFQKVTFLKIWLNAHFEDAALTSPSRLGETRTSKPLDLTIYNELNW